MEAVLGDLPEALRERVLTHWRNYLECADEPVEPSTELAKVWALSDFVAQSCTRNPDLLKALLSSGDLERSFEDGDLRKRLEAALDGVADENDLGERLRRFRRLQMVRIAWRDLAGRADLGEVTADLSALAEACIDAALTRLYDWQCEQKGVPHGSEDKPQQLVVLGMGKLGARELNFSSDIDLIFAYPEEGETRSGHRSTSNQEFFVRLGQRLINALD